MPFYVSFYHLPFYGAFYHLPVSCKRKLDKETGGGGGGGLDASASGGI